MLAAYAVAGGFATPLLLSTGGNHEIFLFTYILAIDIATVMLVRLKSWPRLLLGTFPATVAFFIAWYAEYYGAFNVGEPVVITTVFIVLFFIVFVVPTVYRTPAGERAETPITEVFLPLANATFVALALYSVLQDSHHHDLLPWVAVFFGAVYLGLMRLPQTRVASAVHLSLAVVFLTIAIPLKASGHWITVGWLAEGVALLWVSARLSSPAPEPTAASVHRILRRLAIAALALGFCACWSNPSGSTIGSIPLFSMVASPLPCLGSRPWAPLRRLLFIPANAKMQLLQAGCRSLARLSSRSTSSRCLPVCGSWT